MNILYVVSRPIEINTSASIRNCATINGLLDIGHEVTVVTAEPDKHHSSYDSTLKLDSKAKRIFVKIGGTESLARIGRRIWFPKFVKNYLYRLRKQTEVYDNFKEIINHTKEVKKHGTYDVVISSSDPKSSHLFIYKYLNELHLKNKPMWIQIWGDPFSNDVSNIGYKKQKLIYEEENKLLSKADRIIYVSQLTLTEQKKLFPLYSKKMYYVPIPYIEKKLSVNKDLLGQHTINLAYCGDYSSSYRNIQPLYEALKASHNFHLKICGNGDIQLQDTDSIEILGRQTHSVIDQLEKETDILIHLSNRLGGQIPGKIYHYSATNKPILFILDGESNSLYKAFAKYKRFVFCENNARDILEKLNYICKNNVCYMPIDDFDRKNIAKLLTHLMY